MRTSASSSGRAIRALTRTALTGLLAAAAIGAARADAGDLLFTIRLENRAEGLVQVEVPGERPITVGHVVRGCSALVPTFPAASYIRPPAVAAVSVHGIRLRMPSANSAPMGISIQPLEFRTMPTGYGGHVPGPSAIHTDIPAGSGIFRQLAPLVGDRVLLERGGEAAAPGDGWRPGAADTILIECRVADDSPLEITFENRAGGLVRAAYPGGSTRTLARVKQPLGGVGRFDGTSYTGVGCINTNHTGVITISSAPVTRPADEGLPPESRGGFEIQPSNHATTQPYMPQALVVEPLDSASALEGAAPLFAGTLWLGDGSSVVDIRPAAGSWTPLPQMVGKIDDAFSARGLTQALGKQSGPLGEIRIRVQQRTAEDVRSALASFGARVPTAQSGEAPALEWTLGYPYPPAAVHAVFVVDGQTAAITNQQPYQLTLKPPQTTLRLEARIRDAGGVTLETRTAVATLANGRWSVRPVAGVDKAR